MVLVNASAWSSAPPQLGLAYDPQHHTLTHSHYRLLCWVRCVGGAGLSVVCRLISEDCSGWRGGMPDLLLWRPDRGDAMVSEVKVGARGAGRGTRSGLGRRRGPGCD